MTSTKAADELHDLVWVRAALINGEAQRLRVRYKLSLAQVATPVGVSGTTIWRWERGERKPSGPPAIRYAALLRMLAHEEASR